MTAQAAETAAQVLIRALVCEGYDAATRAGAEHSDYLLSPAQRRQVVIDHITACLVGIVGTDGA